MAQAIADDFPEAMVDRLQSLTGEELYYLKQLLDYEPAPLTKPDVFFRVLQRRARLWLKGEARRHGLPFEHLRKYWQEDFFLLVS
jgi:hypothetical protein